MRARSFATLLTLVISTLVALPAFLGIFIFQRDVITNETKRVESEIESVFGRIQTTFTQELRLMGARVKTLAADSDLRMGNRSVLFFDRISQRLSDFRSDTQLAKEVYFFGSNGSIIASNPPQLETLDLGFLQDYLGGFAKARVQSAALRNMNELIKIENSSDPHPYFLHQQVADIFGEPAGDLLIKIDPAYFLELAQKNLSLDINSENFLKSWHIKESTIPSTLKTKPQPQNTQIRLGQLSLNFDLKPSINLQDSKKRQLITLAIGLAIALAGVAGTWLLTRQFLRPLKSMKAQIQNLESLTSQSENLTNLIVEPKLTPFSEFNEFQNILHKMGAEIGQNVKDIEEAARRESELKRQQITAQLNTLKSQLNPHFLFNALNGIQSMIDVNKHEASEMVQDLSDLYRNILMCTDKVTILLQEEILIVQKYLKLQKRRFGKRLSFETKLPPTKDIWIPSLMIQTLVENAVKHGLEPYKEGCHISVEIEQAIEGYFCTVRNQKQPLESSTNIRPRKISAESAGAINLVSKIKTQSRNQQAIGKGTGTGLSNTQNRLSLLYGLPEPLQLLIDSDQNAEVRFAFSGQKK